MTAGVSENERQKGFGTALAVDGRVQKKRAARDMRTAWQRQCLNRPGVPGF